MTRVIRGDYGLIDLLAIAQWNRANQRAIRANRRTDQPTAAVTCTEDDCINMRAGKSPRCAQHKAERAKAVRAPSEARRAATRKRVRAHRARKESAK